MSEPIWCNVRIVTPKSWGEDRDAIKGVALVSGALINGEAAYIVDESLPDRFMWEMAGEGNYGLSDDEVAAGLDWCREHGVPFHATSDAKYEMEGEIEVFDGERSHEREGDGDGNVVMSAMTFARMREQSEDDGEVMVLIERHFAGLPGVASVSIAHLPAELPVEVDA